MNPRSDDRITATTRPSILATDAYRISTSTQVPVFLICACVFVVAFGIRIILLFATKSYLDVERPEVVNVATSLAQGHGFANAFGNTGPTAHVSPLYPLLLSLLYRCFGTGISGEIAQEILSCCLAALTWGLVPLVGEISQLDRRVGIGAALTGAILTLNRWSETKGSSEAAMAGLACVIVVIFYMKCWYSRDFSIRSAVFAGFLSGVGLLVSASLGSIVLGLLLMGFFLFYRRERRKYLRFGFTVVEVIFAVLLPWALRNYLVLGELIWTRSNLPLELMVSNNDYARPTLEGNTLAGSKYHPHMNPLQRASVTSSGELAYQRKTRAEVLRWIASHPKQFAGLTAQRIYYFWFPEMKRPLQTIALALLTLASIPAMAFLLEQRQLIGYGLLTVWTTYPLVYYLIQTHPRYVYPIQWTMYLLGSESVLLAHSTWKRRTFFRRVSVSPVEEI